MKVGFIGAGKVGVSLGKYFTTKGTEIAGYYSQTETSAKEAAEFTKSQSYQSIAALVQDCNIICLTVPDSVISTIWNQLQKLTIEGKMIIHFSGSLSSTVFTNIENYKAFGYSIHPLYAFNDKFQSYKEMDLAFFTIEGHEKYLDMLTTKFKSFGNEVAIIEANNKTRYHAAAAVVSNLYVGLVAMGEKMLTDCGFSQSQAHQALQPLIHNNTANILSFGPLEALTGPIERNDWQTIESHLNILNPDEKEVYQVLSRLILQLAEEKHQKRDYEKIRGILQH